MYEKTSDEELTKLVKSFQQNNSQQILNDLVLKCERIIQWCCNKYNVMCKTYNIDVEDLKQELYLKFIKSVHLFPENYNSFEKYIFNCLNNHALHFFRYNSNRVDINDYTKGEYTVTSLNYVDETGNEIVNYLEDETSLEPFEQIENDIDKNSFKNAITEMLSNMISDIDINFIYDVYGINKIYTMNEICEKYNITLNKLICWERLIILTIQTNKKLYSYYEQMKTNYYIGFKYTYARWKNSFTSATEYSAIENIYLQNKINELNSNRKMVTLHKIISSCTPENNLIFGEKTAKEFDKNS